MRGQGINPGTQAYLRNPPIFEIEDQIPGILGRKLFVRMLLSYNWDQRSFDTADPAADDALRRACAR